MKRSFTIAVCSLSIGLSLLFFRPVFAETTGLTSDQIQAIILLLRSFGATDVVVQNVDDALNGRTPSAIATSTSPVRPPGPTPVTVLAPDSAVSFSSGEPITVSWSGGEGKVQIGLVDNRYATDGTVLGWISRSELPNGSLVWDGRNVSDITGTVSQTVTSLSRGPYKIIAVSAGANQNFCVGENQGCNYDVSNSYFSIPLSVSANALTVTCSPNTTSVRTGDAVTWEATTTNGYPPYAYNWNGTDGISALPTRSSDSRFLDVIYHSAVPLQKIAGVSVRDAQGRQGVASCSSGVTVTATLPPLVVLSPGAGENFVLARAVDPSQFMRVSWRTNGVSTFGKERFQIALLDTQGRECMVGDAPRSSVGAFVSLVDGYPCPGSNQVLTPGNYRVKVYLQNKGTIISDTSNWTITLSAPVSDVQSITSSATVVSSGESVKFNFSFPSNAVKSSLYVSCPNGITATAPNICNKYTDLSSFFASSTDFTVTFVTTSSQIQDVKVNFYVYLPNNPNYGRGVSTQVSVLPIPTTPSSSVTVVAPNGGEVLRYGVPFVYRFMATELGVLDLTLVPYPPIDANLVCQIATGVPSPAGQVSFTVPADGTCVQGPAKTISGAYKLLATLRNANTKIATDISDSSFTVSASSTSSQ